MRTLAKLNPELPKKVTELFKQITAVSSQTLAQPQSLIPSLARIAQRIVSVGLTEALSREWKYLVKKGVIKDEFSPQLNYCILELLNLLESEMPDEGRFQIMKKILFATASETDEERERHTPHAYMKIIKLLSSEEILIINVIYHILKHDQDSIMKLRNTNKGKLHVFHDDWLDFIAKRTGLKHRELVVLQEQKLIEKQLISPVIHDEVRVDRNFRLTSLGLGIWEYTDKYDELYRDIKIK